MKGIFIKFLMVAALLFTVTITIAGPSDLVITYNERHVHLCQGAGGVLKVFVRDTTEEITDFRFQWFYNANLVGAMDPSWTAISGATEDILYLDNVQNTTSLGNAGYYYCRVYFGSTDDNFRNSNDKIHVDVVTAIPTIESVSAPNSVCESSPLDMQAFNVSGQLSCVWYFDDEIVSRGTRYHVDEAVLENAGVYRFVANNACGDNVYGPYQISVTELPRIVTQPRSAALCGGDDLTFRVIATGSDLQYQWYYDGAPYPSENTSATTSTLVIENAEHNPEFYSNTFNVQVSNACATVTSRNVGTIVSDVPFDLVISEDTSVCAGVELTIYANATVHYPTDTLTYQWYLEGRMVEEGTSNILTFAMDSAHMGGYYCELTNGCGTVRTETTNVYVKMPPVVGAQPEDVAVCEGEQAQLYAKITGFEPIEYIWQNSNGEGLAFTNITTPNTTGVETNTLVADPTSESHERYYFCLASNECGSVRTDTVYITVNQHITVYPALPSGVSICSGSDTTISIANRIYQGSDLLDEDEFDAQGITFAWHKQGETEIVSTEPYLHFSNLQDDETGRYVCDVTNSCGTEENGPIMISVVMSPTITVQPHDLDICTSTTGESFSISLEAEGDNIRYSWYHDGEYITNNSPTLSRPALSQSGGTYYCVVSTDPESQTCPSAYSNTITVNMNTTPVISWEPTPRVMSLCEGEEYGLGMRATGDGIQYQWYNNGNPLAGQTTDSLHISAVTMDNDGFFYCIASNACAEARTVNATLTVNAAPNMTLGPDIHACRGESVLLAPQGQEEYGHYSWNYGTWGYQPTLTVTLGGSYILEVSDSAHGNCVARDTIFVTYHNYFDFSHANFDTTPIVTCGEFVLDAGAGAAEYMWSTTDMTSSITVGMNGYYMVTVDGDGYGCTTSAAVDVTIGEELVINLGDDITAPVTSEVEIGVPAVFESYIWNTGFDGPRLTVDGNDYGIGTHTFWIRVTTGGCEARDTIKINFIEDGEYVDMESMPALNIYPNPASDFVNIVSENGEISDVQLYDMTGRLIFNRQVADEALTLNVAGMADATYFVRVIYTDGKASVSKLIINR